MSVQGDGSAKGLRRIGSSTLSYLFIFIRSFIHAFIHLFLSICSSLPSQVTPATVDKKY